MHGQIISLKAQIKLGLIVLNKQAILWSPLFKVPWAEAFLQHLKGHRHKGLKGTCDFLGQRSKARLQLYSGMQHCLSHQMNIQSNSVCACQYTYAEYS